MDERKLTIKWVGTDKKVRGNVNFIINGQDVVLTADEIDALYKVSIEVRKKKSA